MIKLMTDLESDLIKLELLEGLNISCHFKCQSFTQIAQMICEMTQL